MSEWRAALVDCRQALARLELTSTGSTPNVGGTGGGHPASTPPPPCGSGHWELRRRLQDATTIEELARIERAAILEWEHLTGRGTAGRQRGDGVSDHELVLEAVGHEAQVVAWRYGWDVARVRRVRQRHDQDPEHGLPVEQVKAQADEMDRDRLTVRVLELRSRGRSERQIASAVGRSQSTVRRMLKDAA